MMEEKNISDRRLLNAIVKCARDKKANQIVQIDLRRIKDAPVMWMVIIEATSTTHAVSLADGIKEGVRNSLRVHSLSTTGEQNAEWIAVDYGTVFVHVMLSHMREFYRLEELWGDGKIKDISVV